MGPFYPEGLRPAAFLAAYAEQLDTVEINNSFYRWPSPDTVAGWRAAVPEGFRFAWKASRTITHLKKLKDPLERLARLETLLDGLGPAAGPVLFQLPPRWRVNLDRLAAFLAALPAGRAVAFEFRDPSWQVEPVYALLRHHAAGLCLSDITGPPPMHRVTADLVYVRLHGPQTAYRGTYDDHALADWAERLAAWAEAGRDVYCYFDNDAKGAAPHDALRLKARLATG